jgi:hypothetical protein
MSAPAGSAALPLPPLPSPPLLFLLLLRHSASPSPQPRRPDLARRQASWRASVGHGPRQIRLASRRMSSSSGFPCPLIGRRHCCPTKCRTSSGGSPSKAAQRCAAADVASGGLLADLLAARVGGSSDLRGRSRTPWRPPAAACGPAPSCLAVDASRCTQTHRRHSGPARPWLRPQSASLHSPTAGLLAAR